MLRRLHSQPGLVLAVALTVTAVTGAALSVAPTLDRLSTPTIARGVSVADLAGAVAARHEAVSTIRVRPTGVVTASFSDGEASGVERIDPATGAGLGAYAPSTSLRFLTDLHRAFGLGSDGRVAAALSALTMLVVVLSGVALLARRLGGWRALFRPIRGERADRLHGEVARIAAIGLVVSASTGLWMSASTFGLLPEPAGVETVAASGGAALPVGRLAALGAVDVADLRELAFADPADPTDTVRLKTAAGETAIDPATGRVLASAPATLVDRVDGVVRLLHTGRGAAALGLVLGLSAASVPLLGMTGALMWRRRRSRVVAPLASVDAADADTVILVGSDGGSTRGFAATLADALTATGHAVHVADMNAVAEVHFRADRVLILAATWGDGGAPASASHFLDRLATIATRAPVAVLGFGDRTFPDFCGHARAVTAALAAKGFPFLIETKRIDRRSTQEFAQWGRDLGRALGHELVLEHVADHPAATTLELVEREDYGEAVDAPVAILRFAAPLDATRGRPGRLPNFEAGDLLGVLHPDAAIPRFYSLASSTRDGMVEICVRRMPGGLVSTALHALAPGDRIEAFVRENPSFRPDVAAPSLILIGAGAGLGPLAGFVRESDGSRPVHLYWGGRSPASDFLYQDELARALAEKRLTSLVTAFSRDPRAGAYVQDRIAADEHRFRELVLHGAQILVCGSRDMGQAVAHTLDRIVRPLGLDLATLRAGGRYVEDIY
ncbi:MAG: PepSY domain-containing protein [Hyphomicrobiales bacterium]|nr:PepSY domain-containing protein [Hyphomicrobiales bacterium]